MIRLALKSRCVGLWRRWLGSEPASLDSVEEIQTIGDIVETEDCELPDDWSVSVEIVQFRGESLVEVVRFTNQRDGYRLTLKPTDTARPRGPLDIYTRAVPTAARTHHSTEPSLSAGLAEARRLAEHHTPTASRLRSRSSSLQ